MTSVESGSSRFGRHRMASNPVIRRSLRERSSALRGKRHRRGASSRVPMPWTQRSRSSLISKRRSTPSVTYRPRSDSMTPLRELREVLAQPKLRRSILDASSVAVKTSVSNPTSSEPRVRPRKNEIQARISFNICPDTSVSRKSRPCDRYVSLS